MDVVMVQLLSASFDALDGGHVTAMRIALLMEIVVQMLDVLVSKFPCSLHNYYYYCVPMYDQLQPVEVLGCQQAAV